MTEDMSVIREILDDESMTRSEKVHEIAKLHNRTAEDGLSVAITDDEMDIVMEAAGL